MGTAQGLAKDRGIGDEGPEEAEWRGVWDGSGFLCALSDRNERKDSGEKNRQEMAIEMAHCPLRVEGWISSFLVLKRFLMMTRHRV